MSVMGKMELVTPLSFATIRAPSSICQGNLFEGNPGSVVSQRRKDIKAFPHNL